jgi:hypothetical protein
MKKLLLLIATASFGSGIHAQPWIENLNQPQKLNDIIASYNAKKPLANQIGEHEEKELDNAGAQKEGKDYHFGRWVWYWESHLDEEGYLVSPQRTVAEWKKYKAAKSQGTKYAKTTDQSQWTFNGPTQHLGNNNGIGRVNVIEFHPTDSNVFIIGTAGGGAWRTDNGGMSWSNLYDNLPVLGVSDIDYNPQNPNTIYLCTGDRDGGDTYSVGVLKSTNGGSTWDTTGLQFAPNVLALTNCLVINPLDTNAVTLATNTGIYKSYNGGSTWTLVSGGDFKQIIYNPADTNIIYAASFANGSSQIFRSANGGLNWVAVTALNDSRRIMLAVTPSNPAIVKAVVANMNNGLRGIYSSSDTGNTFARIFPDPSVTTCTDNILNGSSNPGASSCTGQGWYDLSIAMSPTDSNNIIVGGINTWRSANGGISWSIINQAYGGAPGVASVHADKHYHAFHPLSPNTLFECNDGGIYKAGYPHTVWNNLSNGLAITQFYRIAAADVATFVLGGSQDNGTKRINFDSTSSHVTGGDGMDCQIDPTSSSVYYTSSQNGTIYKNGSNISNNIPGDPTGEWITPFLLHPNDPFTIFAGYTHLYMSNNQGSNWMDITPNFSTTGNLMKRIAMTAQDDNLIYIQSGTNTIRYTFDQGGNWTTIATAFSGPVSDIKVNPKDKNHLWVTYGGYGSTRVAEYRIGLGWKKLNDSLPNVPVQCVVIDSSNGTVYLGTDVGVFYRDHTMSTWEEYNNNLPTVEVTDLEINYATNEIWASTYGRGMWKSPRHIAVPNGISNVPYALDVITIAPNPNNGNFSIRTGNKSLIGQSTSVRVMSYTGASVMQTEGRFDSAGNLSVNSGNLARGTYIVEVNMNGIVYARNKMLVLQ